MFDASAYYDPRLPWTGRADLLRQQRAGVALVTELGRNYDTYNQALVDHVAGRKRPDPDDYDSLRSYLEAWADLQVTVGAEFLLRNAVLLASGKPLLSLAESPPLVSAGDELLHLDDDAAQTAATSR